MSREVASVEAWEEQALRSIEDDLAASAPEFASRLAVFNRLTCGEQVPDYPKAKVEGRRWLRRFWAWRDRRRDRAGRSASVRGPGVGQWPAVIFISAIVVMTVTGLVLGLAVHTPGGSSGENRQAVVCALGCEGR